MIEFILIVVLLLLPSAFSCAARYSNGNYHRGRRGRPFVTEWSYGKSRRKAKEATGKN
jgi:hypothetical protein